MKIFSKLRGEELDVIGHLEREGAPLRPHFPGTGANGRSGRANPGAAAAAKEKTGHGQGAATRSRLGAARIA